MGSSDTNEKTGDSALSPCPYLPLPESRMTYRNLRNCPSPDNLFDVACTYANYLWMQDRPARAILALCRAIYLAPTALQDGRIQPYKAFVWMIRNHSGSSFLGNPRISFVHQATRVASHERLKRNRAWALWYLAIKANPGFPPDPAVPEYPPSVTELAEFLDLNGLNGEGEVFLKALDPAESNRG